MIGSALPDGTRGDKQVSLAGSGSDAAPAAGNANTAPTAMAASMAPAFGAANVLGSKHFVFHLKRRFAVFRVISGFQALFSHQFSITSRK